MKIEIEIETEKKIDAVKFMRKERERVSKEIIRMTAEEEIAYFRKKSAELRKGW